jgi:large subunit ribosomal protein L24
MERKYNKQQKLHIRKGDTVVVLAGNDKDKDWQGSGSYCR